MSKKLLLVANFLMLSNGANIGAMQNHFDPAKFRQSVVDAEDGVARDKSRLEQARKNGYVGMNPMVQMLDSQHEALRAQIDSREDRLKKLEQQLPKLIDHNQMNEAKRAQKHIDILNEKLTQDHLHAFRCFQQLRRFS